MKKKKRSVRLRASWMKTKGAQWYWEEKLLLGSGLTSQFGEDPGNGSRTSSTRHLHLKLVFLTQTEIKPE